MAPGGHIHREGSIYMNNEKLQDFIVKSNLNVEASRCFNSFCYRKVFGNVEISASELSYFKAGYIAALQEIERAKKIKSDSKTGKFNIYDFLDVDILKQCKAGKYGARYFLSGVYHDSDNKKLVTTNGNFLIYCDAGPIEECFKNQIVSKENRIIDGRFPQWQRVVPSMADMVEVENCADKIMTCNQFTGNKTQPQAAKCKDTFYIDGLALSSYMLFMISKFIKTQKSVIIYRNKESYNKAWSIIGDNATMVFMPLKNTDKIISGEDENPFTKIYDSEKNIVIDNVKAA